MVAVWRFHCRPQVCVAWTREELGLCAGSGAAHADCQLNSDCQDHSASCQRALYLDAERAELAVRGFCLPALFFMRYHKTCEQGRCSLKVEKLVMYM